MTDLYEPREDSFLLSGAVRRFCRGKVLDVGTGTGIQAQSALESGRATEITAVDLNLECRNSVKKLSSRIRFIRSNLFGSLPAQKFDTIIFNPPYLPQDKGISDPTIYGGRKGYELVERFLHGCSRYLAEDGIILLLFSSLTGKDKIDSIIGENCLESRELCRKSLPFFERLYVYGIRKSGLLKELESKGTGRIKRFSKGRRGIIFTGKLGRKKVAIKAKRPDSRAKGRIENEIRWLKALNKRGIGPELLFHGRDYFVYRFIEGEFIMDFIKGCRSRKTILKVLKDALAQCRTMDWMKVTKEEMLRPWKHLIVTAGNRAEFIDFERCRASEKPKNVTQFCQFLTGGSVQELLKGKGISVNRKLILERAAAYKKDQNAVSYGKIEALIRGNKQVTAKL